MAEAPLEVSHDSTGEVEVYVDPSEEVFFGPVTERERQLRKHLPRKTLHPCEIIEISKRGMDFHQWDSFKAQQLERNERNEEAIEEVFGLDSDEDKENCKKDDFKNQTHKNPLDVQPIQDRPSIETTNESFNSCTSMQENSEDGEASVSISSMENSDEGMPRANNQSNDVSGVASLNDTWEMQERMLALAEKLERGEDLPELGIYRHASGAVEYVSRSNSTMSQHSDKEITNLVNHIEISTSNHSENEDDKGYVIDEPASPRTDCADGIPEILTFAPRDSADSVLGKLSDDATHVPVGRKTPSVDFLTQEMDELALTKRTISETPMKDPSGLFNLPTPLRKAPSSASRTVSSGTPVKTPIQTPVKTPSGSAKKKPLITPSKQPGSVEKKPQSSCNTPAPTSASKLARPNSSLKVKPSVHAAASPVGLYIRSLPEPMLIENVRSSTKKKEVQTNPAAIKPPRMAIKNKDGRWSTARTPSKEPVVLQPSEIKPVLPVVLHEAAASMINEKPATPVPTTPGVGGKIGKLLERAVTPTVLKHQGRIQVPKNSDKKIINSPLSNKADKRSDADSMLEVSVLEKMVPGKSSIPVRQTALLNRKLK